MKRMHELISRFSQHREAFLHYPPGIRVYWVFREALNRRWPTFWVSNFPQQEAAAYESVRSELA